MPGMAGFACQRHMHSVNTRVQSTHCEPGGRQGDHAGVPSGGSQGDPSSLEEKRASRSSQLSRMTLQSQRLSCRRAIHLRGIWGGGGSALPEASARTRRIPHLLWLHPQARRRSETHRRPRMLSPRGNSSPSWSPASSKPPDPGSNLLVPS